MKAFVLFLLLVCHVAASAAQLTIVAGGPDNTPLESKLHGPFAVDFDAAGNMYIAEMPGERIRKLSRDGVLSTVAGDGKRGATGDGGPATLARIGGVHHMVLGADDQLYLADTWNNKVRVVNLKTGIITTFAGTGEKGFSGDGGAALLAKMGGIYCLALDKKGNQLYLCDLDNRRIRRIDLKTQVIQTVAGNGSKGVPTDGTLAIEAPLVDPRAIALGRKGELYILERGGNALRVVEPSGKLKTVVGTGKKGPAVDEVDAASATLNGPKHLEVDSEGNVLIADTENHVILKYLPGTGKVLRIAGTGVKGADGVPGDAKLAQLSQPHGVYVHPSGDLYLSDSSNNRVLKYSIK